MFCMCMFLFQDFTLSNILSLSVNNLADFSSVLDSTDDSITFSDFFQIININSFNLISFHCGLNEVLHFSSLFFFIFVFSFLTILFIDEFSVDLKSIVFNYWWEYLYISVLSSFFGILNFFVFISTKGKTDKNKEKDKGDPGFPCLYILILQEQEHENIG
jgi:hypothetical protein